MFVGSSGASSVQSSRRGVGRGRCRPHLEGAWRELGGREGISFTLDRFQSVEECDTLALSVRELGLDPRFMYWQTYTVTVWSLDGL
jgi:hypothetical protein